MKNVWKIYKRLTEVNVKQRFLPFYLPIINVIIALVVLIFINMIVSRGNIDGSIDYMRLRLFYGLIILILFALISFFAPMIFSTSINSLKKNNTIDYMLSVKIKIEEIVFAVFLRGFFTLMVLLFSTFPIICVGFYFGGMSYIKLIRLFVCLFSFSLLISTISLYISSIFEEVHISKIISLLISFILLVVQVFINNILLNSFIWCFAYFIILFIVSLVLLYYSHIN